jgi:hypothetical protein
MNVVMATMITLSNYHLEMAFVSLPNTTLMLAEWLG